MKKLILFLYAKFVGEPYLTWNCFATPPHELDAKNIKGTITIKKDEYGKFMWLEIEQFRGFSSWEYLKFPFWRFSRRVPPAKKRVHSFAYDLKTIQE